MSNPKVDIKYNDDTRYVDVIVTYKRTKKVVGVFINSTLAYESAKFLTRTFHEIYMDAIDESHKAAVEAIKESYGGTNDISK